MAISVETERDASVASLAGGIAHDMRELFVEQMKLFQIELTNHVRQTLMAMVPLGAGIAICVVAMLLLAMGGAYFVAWQATLPVWAGFLILGAVIVVLGIALILWSKSMLDRVHLTPDVALKGLKENLQWKTKN